MTKRHRREYAQQIIDAESYRERRDNYNKWSLNSLHFLKATLEDIMDNLDITYWPVLIDHIADLIDEVEEEIEIKEEDQNGV